MTDIVTSVLGGSFCYLVWLGWVLAREMCASVALQALQVALLAAGVQHDRHARATGATRAPGAVDVAFTVLREVVLHD